MAHRLFIGKGMITLNLKRIFLTLTLLPLFAVAADDCALSDPALTVQAYIVNPQTERVKMYWQKANGEAWGTLHALLADINSQGQVQMAMNGGIYDESYAPLGLYIENGQQKVALNLASGEGNLFVLAECFMSREIKSASFVWMPLKPVKRFSLRCSQGQC